VEAAPTGHTTDDDDQLLLDSQVCTATAVSLLEVLLERTREGALHEIDTTGHATDDDGQLLQGLGFRAPRC